MMRSGVVGVVLLSIASGRAPGCTLEDGPGIRQCRARDTREVPRGLPGEGTGSHLALEELMHAASVKLTHVPFAGWAEGSPALLGGHIEAIVAQPGEVRPLVEAKKMRLLTVFQPARNAVFPDVPTCKEVGYDVQTRFHFLLLAPKSTPEKIVRYLHDAAKASLEDVAFASFAKARVIDVDYRPGDKLRGDLWEEYRKHTDILERVGMLKR